MPDVGRKGSGSHTQSVIFNKAAGWTKASSRSWLKKHKMGDKAYYTDGYDETANSHRWRQFDTDDTKFRYRNNVIERKDGKPSITLVLGFPEGSEALAEFDAYVARTQSELTADDIYVLQTSHEGESQMSLIAELTAAQEMIANLTEQLTAKGAELEAGALAAQEKITAMETSLATEQTERQAEVATATEALTAMTVERDTAGQERDAAKVEKESITKELDKAKVMLKNPAFFDAGVLGEETPAAAGGEAADAEGSDILAEYDKIADGQAKTKFWKEHSAEILEARQAIREAEAAEASK